MTDAQDELKKYIKEHTSGKGETTCIFIKIRDMKEAADLKIKDEGKGVIELRVHTTDEKLPKWFVHAIMIDLKNFNLTYKEIKNKQQLQDILLSPGNIAHEDTRKKLRELEKEFGGLVPDGSDKLFWRTERFKKKKDLMQVKRKAL